MAIDPRKLRAAEAVRLLNATPLGEVAQPHVVYAVSPDKQSVVIGPDVEVAGTSGKAHEFGGRYKREQYDKRPFMGPALDKTKQRLPALWAGSVKG